MRIAIINALLIINIFALNLPKFFSASFTQTITSKEKKITYKGNIYTNSKNVYWKYIYPNAKEIWITNEVTVYEPDLLQVTISKKPKFNIFSLIKKAKKIGKNTYEAKIDGKKVTFIFDKTLKKAWYKDDVGNRVEIDFYNQSDKKIDPSIFKPKYPKDVDVIYQY